MVMPDQATESSNPTCGILLPVEIWERVMTYIEPKYMNKICQLSRRHHDITKSTIFRARYFASRSMPCQALYSASRRPKIFTPELIRCMLNQGAVLSRYFAQALLQRISGGYRLRGNARWGTDITSKAINEVLNEAVRLFDESFKYSSPFTDGSQIKSWAESSVRVAVLNDDIREIFIHGRFAIFSLEDPYFPSLHLLSGAIAQHPELLRIMVENGYEYNKIDHGRIVRSILETRTNEEHLYARLDTLLKEYPDWIISADNTNIVEYIHKPFSGPSFSPVPLDEAGLTILNENDGVGPIDSAIKVLKRLCDEERAFLDLDTIVIEHVLHCQDSGRSYNSWPSEHAASLRILMKLFPNLWQDFKDFAAVSYVCAFQVKASTATANDITRGHKMLFKLFEEMEMDSGDLAMLFSDDRFSYDKLIAYAIKEGKVGQLKDVDKRGFLKQVIQACLFRPMSGHKLEEIEAAMKDLVPASKIAIKRASKANEMLIHDLSEAFMEWQFDLNTLKPDRKAAVEHKLRTPIAWMVKGSYAQRQGGYTSGHYALTDAHCLFPPYGRPRHSNETTELSFAAMPCKNDDQKEETVKTKTSEPTVETKNEEVHSPGWKFLGHVDELHGSLSTTSETTTTDPTTTEEFHNAAIDTNDAEMQDDSGIAIVDDDDFQGKGESIVSASESGTNVERDAVLSLLVDNGISTMTRSTSMEPSKKLPVTGKIGNFPTYTMRVLRSHCSLCFEGQSHSCSNPLLPFDAGAKELAVCLQKYLPPTSSALRDIVLAHALVNGNEDMAKKLMEGEWKGESKGTDVAKASTKAANLAKGRLGAPEQPVSPTFAHLRILQALERKPIPIFLQTLLHGAPFKRGYVKSSLPSRMKEHDWKRRDEVSKSKGRKDDRRLEALFEVKRRLEDADKKSKRKQRRKDAEVGSDSFNPPGTAGRSLAENSTASTRAHLARSARKAIRYTETNSLSSDEEEDEDGDEEDDSILVIRDSTKKNSSSSKFEGAIKEKISGEATSVSRGIKMVGDGILDDGSDLSELSEQENESRLVEGYSDESETEESESEADEADVYGLKEEDVPKVKVKVENEEEMMELVELDRRCKSLRLWLEHAQLLLWFERRKERIAKEKAARARDADQRYERMSKSVFSKSISEMVNTMEMTLSTMQSTLTTALVERKSKMKEKRSSQSIKGNNSKKRKQNEEVKARVKTEEEEVEANSMANADDNRRPMKIGRKGEKTAKASHRKKKHSKV